MKIKVIAAAFLMLGACALSANAQFGPPKDGAKLDAVVGIVGKHPIYKSSIDAQTQLYLLQRGVMTTSADTLQRLRKQILDGEIDQKLWLAKADDDSITVTEAEVDEVLDQRIRAYVAHFGSEAAVKQATGQSVAELKASPTIREQARESLITQKEQEKSLPRSQTISRQDVKEFFAIYKDSLPPVGEAVELATIVKLVKVLPDQKGRSRAFAKSLVDSLHHGADFADLAKRYSQHSTAASGGDLGSFFSRGTFLAEFEAVAFNLKPGEVSDVVETDQGFHIIKLIERRGEEIHVAQILIKPTINSADESAIRDSLNLIRERATKGEDFAGLAREYSDDPETKPFGGSLGRSHIEDFASEQRGVVDSLKEGEISKPIHIAYPDGRSGFQIVKLIRKVPTHAVSLTEDYRELEAAAIQWKQTQEAVKWLAKARSTVFIDIHDLSNYY